MSGNADDEDLLNDADLEGYLEESEASEEKHRPVCANRGWKVLVLWMSGISSVLKIKGNHPADIHFDKSVGWCRVAVVSVIGLIDPQPVGSTT